jgi:protein disulfide-isomerase A1
MQMRRVLLPALVAFAHAGEAWDYDENVAVLDADNFDAFLASQEYTLVEFYAPWCGHCKSLAPEWAAAAAKTKKLNPPVLLAKVDADKHRELAERFNVEGYPTIKIFKGGKAEEYEGPRETKGIVSFVKKAVGITGAGSLTQLSSAEELTKLVADGGGYALVGLFREPVKASAMFSVFGEVASDLPSYTSKAIKAAYSASYSNDPVAASLGIKSPPAILLYTPSATEPLSYKIPRKRDEFTEEVLVEWLQSHLQ